MSEQPISTETEASEGKIAALLSYFGLLGLLIAYLMTQNKKNSFVSYHMRQGLGFLILAFVIYIAMFIIVMIIPKLSFLMLIAMLAIFAFWIIGVINAFSGKKKPLPLVGDQFESWFHNTIK